jgi:hypothetical protein
MGVLDEGGSQGAGPGDTDPDGLITLKLHGTPGATVTVDIAADTLRSATGAVGSDLTTNLPLDNVPVELYVTPVYYDLTVVVDGTGTGTTTPVAGVHNYLEGTSVDIIAVPDGSDTFVITPGTPVLMDGNKTVTVTYTYVPTAEVCRDKFTSAKLTYYDSYTIEPLAWCWQYQCRGDGDDAEEFILFDGWYRVYNADLAKLIANWHQTAATADPIADFTQSEEFILFDGWYAVYNADLALLISNWHTTSGALTDCPTYLP